MSFLDLPAEIRNQIYEDLLPDRDEGSAYRRTSGLRKDGQKTSTSFMATCKQLQAEAASMLYGKSRFCAYLSVGTGELAFLNQRVLISDCLTANFAALNQIKRLGLTVITEDSCSICDVQDTLFHFLGHLQPNHKLQSLKVDINIATVDHNSDRLGCSEASDLSHTVRAHLVTFPHDYNEVRPGDLSIPHIAAFLTDPIRTVRGLMKDDGRDGKFALEFDGSSSRPWSLIAPEVRTLARSAEPVPDYQVFGKYWDALRPLLQVIETIVGQEGMRAFRMDVDAMHCSRVRGDVARLRQYHKSFVHTVDLIVMKRYDWG